MVDKANEYTVFLEADENNEESDYYLLVTAKEDGSFTCDFYDAEIKYTNADVSAAVAE
tara:strand:+ start:388 stop:561 length:174 start_codon:yes stop_codon:yes gene_type:complete